MGAVVLGLDVGGTTTRAVVADLAGRRLGAARCEGGNPNSHPPEEAAARVAGAVRAALASVEASEVQAAVLAMAGASKLSDPGVAAVFEREWLATGLRCPMRVVRDVEAGFAAGAAEPDGTALVAGTGSIACRIRGHRMVRAVGGHGWLLGDEGSAFWLGREAVRATLRVLEGRLPDTGLASVVLAAALGTVPPDPRDRLITAVNGERPVALARYAPLVTSAAAEGDPVAGEIVATAAAHLAELVITAHDREGGRPVVLVGGLTEPGNPVGEALRARLAAEGLDVRAATDGAAGAAWLAALDLVPGLDDAAALHRALLGG
ncbi:BadF-type ATPase [Streptoalloteichus tenebrarius]|uniref:BadF-type ATPase n=1 Tax=Streptoalloteichus tenebrarius (strain ATCC 17920 / DSM 40477 / JCM 4838 / CBS 697.72 / NBRC 16177 / NCIMB 11028 / NRRL B-12390 / A12253. 1 / ISP 5477) TaxID=1933 RepID=A0ABT1HYM5_STRSD|nr:BadF/BadG/BcrA/BcrD ATPase family protein [Streptoalloteichus tenebrarius]MCP2260627.1 BadF-type ATPase [Streptoalloteichus tenebrarius]BFF01511.1 BadF/BadG/BcrA/BcrD ATPase family protein [Streptoalloteichus tenebrarius]